VQKHRLVDSQWFALADLLLVPGSLAVCMLEPGVGRWIILVGLLPWLWRAAAGRAPFRRTPFDWPIAIFLITAWVGYWAAFDKTTAWDKVWWIVAAVLLYYAIAAQPPANLAWVCCLFLLVGVGVSAYYLLTYDFQASPRRLELVNRLGGWLMGIRPLTGWTTVHPNYAGGLAVLAMPFVLPPLRKWRRLRTLPVMLYRLAAAAGLSVLGLALFMSTSRGAFMAAAGGAGVWGLWKVMRLSESRIGSWIRSTFPAVVMLYLIIFAALIYYGPASTGSVGENYHFGNGSRAELFSRSLYLVQDYPITGGGLGSFPGLYSRYILNIPYFNVPNSHNLFLDTAIEQGIPGAAAFLLIYLASIWRIAGGLSQEGRQRRLLAWVALFALIAACLHGLVDDYLYNNKGTVLALIFPAFSIAAFPDKGMASVHIGRFHWRAAGAVVIVLVAAFLFVQNKILTAWYSDLGAVAMSKVDLEVFPGGGWVGPGIAGRMGEAEQALQTSLVLDPNNRTANQRLGMISMLRQDFEAGSRYLSSAYRETPEHRGVLKSLGFCRVWLGDFAGARELLLQIPEAQEELDAYVWWWGTQERQDLSANASLVLDALKNNNQ